LTKVNSGNGNNNTTNNTTNLTNNIHNTQNIIINSYGKENLSYILSNSNYLISLMRMPYMSVPNILRNIHFHPNHPENHNVKITNKKYPLISIFKNNRWEYYDKREMIRNIMDAGFNIIEGNATDDHKKHLTDNQNYRFEKFKDEYYDDNKRVKKFIEKKTELTILNESKNIVKASPQLQLLKDT